jgi:hypothetical protein
MIHVTTTAGEVVLFELTEKVQFNKHFSFRMGGYNEKKEARSIDPGDWIR